MNAVAEAMKDQVPINCPARNAVWAYPKVVAGRFRGAPTIIETVRTHEMPDICSLPEGSDIAVELWGAAVLVRLDGGLHRVYIARYEWIGFPSDEDARYAFTTLWKEVELLESPEEVERAAAAWLAAWKRRSAGQQ